MTHQAAVLIAGEDEHDKKPQRYAKDNRTAHLTANVTNNKRLLDVLYC